MNRKRLFSVVSVCALVATLTLSISAQGPRGGAYCSRPGSGGNGNQTPLVHIPPVFMTVSGMVTTLNSGSDRPHSTMTLKDSKGNAYTILVGPPPFLEDKKFVLALNDSLTVILFPDFRNGKLWAAKAITNTTTGAAITLRDDSGVPLWMGSCRHGCGNSNRAAFGMHWRGGRPGACE
jgi:hypothetical protein